MTCNAGYTGGGTATCSTGGTFNALTCSANTCTATNVANSNKAASKSITGKTSQTVTVTCDTGYTGGGTATCGTNGQFNTLTCAANTCTAAGNIVNSDKAASGSITGTTGQTVTVTCDTGYSGGGTATCGTNGAFNTLACAANTCTATGNIANSNKAASSSITGTTGQTATVTCDTGYTGGGTATCGTNGAFNTLTCPGNSCTAANVANSNKAAIGSISGTTSQTVTVTCTAGYTGGGTATCGTNGAFNSLSCTKLVCTCPNGIATLGTGSGATYCDTSTVDCSACNAGYTISATAASGSAQTCKVNTCTATQVANSNKATMYSITGKFKSI